MSNRLRIERAGDDDLCVSIDSPDGTLSVVVTYEELNAQIVQADLS